MSDEYDDLVVGRVPGCFNRKVLDSRRGGTLVQGVARQNTVWVGRRPAEDDVAYFGVARRCFLLVSIPICVGPTRD